MKKPYHLTAGASQNNAFTRPYNGEHSIFAGDFAFAANASTRASKARESAEAKGINVAQIPGMGSETFRQDKRADFHVAPKALDTRGRPVVQMEPRAVGAIHLSKTGQADKAKTARILSGSL